MFSAVWPFSDAKSAASEDRSVALSESRVGAVEVGKAILKNGFESIPTIADVFVELKAVREDVKRIYREQGLAQFGGSSSLQEKLPGLIEDAFAKHRWLQEQASVRASPQSNLLQDLDKVISERLRDQSSAICNLMRQVVADEVQNALRASQDRAVGNASPRPVHDTVHPVHDTVHHHALVSHLGGALEKTEARLLTAIQDMERRTPKRLPRTRLPASSSGKLGRTGRTPQTNSDRILAVKVPENSTVAFVGDGDMRENIERPGKALTKAWDSSAGSWCLSKLEGLVSGPSSQSSIFTPRGADKLDASMGKTKTESIQKHFHIEWLSNIVFSLWFRLLMGVCVTANTIYIAWMQTLDLDDALTSHGVTTDWGYRGAPSSYYSAGDRRSDWDGSVFHHTHPMEFTFAIFFMLVAVLSFVACPYWFLTGRGRKYYFLDVTICITFFGDLLVCAILGHGGDHALPNLTFLLMIHSIWDFCEATQSSEVASFIRVILKGSGNSLTVVWAVIFVVVLICYFFGTVLVHGVTTHLKNNAPGAIASGELKLLAEGYGSMPIALFLLSMGISGGVDWKELILPLRGLPPFYTLWAFGFIAFAILGLLNVTTAIFVDFALQASDRNKNEQIRKRLSQQAEWEQKIIEVFKEADTDHSGTLTWEEFHTHMEHPIIVAYFDSLQLDITEAKGLFTLLDVKDAGYISVCDFVKGCAHLKGDAKSLDLATLRYEFLHFSIHYMHDIESIKSQLAFQLSAIQELAIEDSDVESVAEKDPSSVEYSSC